MQAVLALPGPDEVKVIGGNEQSLCRKVCGIPLLTRVLVAARQSGCTSVLLLRPKNLQESCLRTCLDSALLSSLPLRTLILETAFDPANSLAWRQIAAHLDSKFVWLPWNSIPDKNLLSQLIEAGARSKHGARFVWPAASNRERCKSESCPSTEATVFCVSKELVTDTSSPEDVSETGGVLRRCLNDSRLDRIQTPRPPSIEVHCLKTLREVERALVRRSGKDSDGIYSRLNRRLCWPAVRWLSKTAVSPNQVTFAGLLVALLSALAFAQGKWSAYVLGAALYFIAVLFDEMDGMLARITFRESAFGTWLETFADYASYFFLFMGMTVGLYRQSGSFWLWTGVLTLFGALASFYAVGQQRRLATDPERPHEYRTRLHRTLEADRGSLLSRLGRQLDFLVRKPAFCHYVLIFTLFGGLKILFLLVALSANLVWILTLHFNRLFRPGPVREAAQ